MKMTLNIRNYLPSLRDFLILPNSGRGAGYPDGRLDFIDGLRGITMILVVYWHVLVMSLNVTTYTAMTLQLFRMPLFFFISGFFAYSFNYDRDKLKKRLGNRWHKQLLPTFIIFTSFIIFEVTYYGNYLNFGEFLNELFKKFSVNGISEFKSGYWFTFVLVEVFCLFALINYLLSSRKVSRNIQGFVFLGIAGLCALIEWFYSGVVTAKSPKGIQAVCEFFSLTHLIRYQVFFYLGAAARAFDRQLWKFLSRNIVGIAVLALTLVVFWFTPRFRVPVWAFYGAACTGILFSITLFFYLRRFFTGNGALGRLLKFIGKNTLPIYLFHYFIIRMMKDLQLPWLVSGIKAGAWAEIPIVALISLAIVLTVLGVDSLLKIKPRIHKIIFAC
ncbi:MAG: acyltransferase [Muribaculaceae bacterium]|nr:acyltransferase [Muribaculaceae bacterium]